MTNITLDAPMNAALVDRRIVQVLQDFAWDEHTTFPLCKDAFTAANNGARRNPAIGQCLVTALLLHRIYPQGALQLLDVDDSKTGPVPHFLFWKDAHLYSDVKEARDVRSAQKVISKLAAAGKLALQDIGVVDLTARQFSRGSTIRFIDPLCNEYTQRYYRAMVKDKSLDARENRLVRRFNNALIEHHGLTIEGLTDEIEKSEGDFSPLKPPAWRRKSGTFIPVVT